jgi:beta-lactamase class A
VEKVGKRLEVRKPEINRKLIAWAFFLTGIVSLGLWWNGRGSTADLAEGTGWWEGWIKPVEISLDVKPTEESSELKDLTIKRREVLLEEMEERVATASGTYSVYVYELDRQEGWGFNHREKMPGASILKLPVLVAGVRKIEAGEWSLEQEVELVEADRSPGSGPLQFEPAGTKVKIGEVLKYLGRNSDNTAWLLLNRLIGVRAIEDVMLMAGMTDSTYAAGSGDITAVDVGKLLVKIYRQEIAGSEGKKLIVEYLTNSIYEDRITMGVPEGSARVIHKVGTLADVWSDAGIIEPNKTSPFVVVILNKGVLRQEATGLVPWLTRQVWEFESKELSGVKSQTE